MALGVLDRQAEQIAVYDDLVARFGEAMELPLREQVAMALFNKGVALGDLDRRVAQVAAARGIPRAQVALAWLLSKPVITAPIVGATKLHHLDDALASVNVKLSADEITSLEEPYFPHAVVGFV